MGFVLAFDRAIDYYQQSLEEQLFQNIHPYHPYVRQHEELLQCYVWNLLYTHRDSHLSLRLSSHQGRNRSSFGLQKTVGTGNRVFFRSDVHFGEPIIENIVSVAIRSEFFFNSQRHIVRMNAGHFIRFRKRSIA